VMRWLAKCTEVRVREPELTVQCRGWLPGRGGSGAVGDARVAVRRVGVAYLGRAAVQHHVGRDPAAVPRATLYVVQTIDAAVLPGVVGGVADHVHLGAVRDVAGAVSGGAVVGERAEARVAEDLDAVVVVDVVLHRLERGAAQVAASSAGHVIAASGAADLLTIAGLDVVHVVTGGLACGAAADQQ